MRETVYQANQWKTTEEQAFVFIQLSCWNPTPWQSYMLQTGVRMAKNKANVGVVVWLLEGETKLFVWVLAVLTNLPVLHRHVCPI